MHNDVKRSWFIIIGLSLITAIFGFFIPKIILDNEVKIYFPHNHPSYINHINLEEIYGSQIFLVVSINNPNGSIINAKAIERIRDLTNEFEKLDGVVKVQSIANVDYVTGSPSGGLVSENLLPDDFSGSDADLVRLRERISDWSSMYSRIILSEDGSGSEIVLTVDHNISADKMSELYRTVRGIVDKYKHDEFDYRVAGDPVLAQMARDYMLSDLSRLVPAVVIVVLLTLLFSFKTLEGTLLPLITVVFSTVWTVGIMAVLGIHFTVVSSCLPVLLIAVGSAYGIHVVNHYYEELAHDFADATINRELHAQLVKKSLKKVVLPVVLAGVTTIVGFFSTVTSPIVPLKTFAIFSSIGVTFALILSLLLIPAFLIVKPLPKDGKLNIKTSHRKNYEKGIDSTNLGVRSAAKLNNVLHDHAVTVGVVIGFIIVVSIWGMTKINVESALLSYFPKTSQLRQDVEFIDHNFAGSNLMSIVIHGKEKGDLTDPIVLKAMDDLTNYIHIHHPIVGKTISYTDFIRRMNKIMNAPQSESEESIGSNDSAVISGDSFFADSSFVDENVPSSNTVVGTKINNESSSLMKLQEPTTLEDMLALLRKAYALSGSKPTVESMLAEMEKLVNYKGAAYDEIPVDPEKYPVSSKEELKNLIAQYLVLYSGSLDEYSDDQLSPSAARMAVQFRTHNTSEVERVIKDLKGWAKKNLPEGYSLETSGIAEMEVSLTSMITSSQLSSLLLAILSVFIILAISFKSPLAGLIGSLPLSISILINFGIMGFLGINLDMVTSLISSIAIGIGVDYTIHFMNNYHHERLQSDDLKKVTFNTYMVSGKAILINAGSVALGFLVLCFSEFVVLRYIGFLVAVVMVTSSVTALTVLPLILNLVKPKFISRQF
ncbi:efflux RND transporter permease subunit [Gracilinema caldarium]|uniref:SSD domain-containing protein n=1 Tax=Gracilinema caldarium (strain ATCC 51460 / DSM 7334 / H1) TaxID=744872 RepID=F8EZU1_GRAC1|nr:MMPL family transporter [Gracilinema caldarium]AEJ18454.1 hypothetical protein Spica_0288 [Gracilinema caldarium DSM 7334]